MVGFKGGLLFTFCCCVELFLWPYMLETIPDYNFASAAEDRQFALYALGYTLFTGFIGFFYELTTTQSHHVVQNSLHQLNTLNQKLISKNFKSPPQVPQLTLDLEVIQAGMSYADFTGEKRRSPKTLRDQQINKMVSVVT